MINAIVACDYYTGGIGYENGLPWRLKSDLEFFKQMTTGASVIMGYNTMLSLPNPLPNRTNFVMVKDGSVALPEGFVAILIDQAKDLLSIFENSSEQDMWVIGGGRTYQFFEDMIERWYIVNVKSTDSKFDTYFRVNTVDNFVNDFEETERVKGIVPQPETEFPKYSRKVLKRIPKTIEMDLSFNNTNDFLERAYKNHVESFNSIFGELVNKVVSENMTSHKYHDTKHLVGSALLAFVISAESECRAAMQFGLTGLGGTKFMSVVRPHSEQTVRLTIAMLFHDFCYLGDKDDQINLSYSKGRFRGFYSENKIIFNRIAEATNWKTKNVIKSIEKCIEHTLYDFDNPYPEVNGCTLDDIMDFTFIRDIDQLYASVYFNKEMFDKLYHDIGMRFDFSREEFIQRNIEYYKNLMFYTTVIEGIFNDITSTVIKEHKNLI